LNLFDSLNEASAGFEWRLERDELEDLREKGCLLELDPGDVLIESGAVESDIYILVDGLLIAYSHAEGTLPCGWIRPGEVAGEMAYLLGNNVRTATVKAALPSKVLMVRRQALQQWMETSPALSAKFFHRTAYALARRLRARQST
jgi:CRP-like cAMP-binding protein